MQLLDSGCRLRYQPTVKNRIGVYGKHRRKNAGNISAVRLRWNRLHRVYRECVYLQDISNTIDANLGKTSPPLGGNLKCLDRLGVSLLLNLESTTRLLSSRAPGSFRSFFLPL